ncbi:MAG: hypothetical protein FJX68_12900 [Alphaproteobacteria bacterium]|nr:hypothetical protein [Alphaproteobacteria bacterium]
MLLRIASPFADEIASEARVRQAQDCAAALAILTRTPIAAAVVDFDGDREAAPAFLAAIRDPHQTPSSGLPVLGLLRQHSAEAVRRAVRAGIDHVMLTPISAATLVHLALQLRSRPAKQIRTVHYVGPDRRRIAGLSYSGPDRREPAAILGRWRSGD